mgnify:CR=1 FL=1
MILASRAHCAFRRFGIFCALVPAATLFPLKAEGQATPGEARLPNVLILLADDLTYLLNGIDMPGVRTPNLDRLAAEGVRFTRAAANHPV